MSLALIYHTPSILSLIVSSLGLVTALSYHHLNTGRVSWTVRVRYISYCFQVSRGHGPVSVSVSATQKHGSYSQA